METDLRITRKREKELKQELEDRRGDLRKEILERLVAARALGDLSENAEYHAARSEQGLNESRIEEIELILKNAIIISPRKKGGIIDIGSRVVIRKVGEKKERKITLVGPVEADIAAGKMSITSPIGSALIGKTTGDTVEVKLPTGTKKFKICSAE
jgi:transcription elongation factor GreA